MTATQTPAAPVTPAAVREFLDRQKTLADTDLADERARLVRIVSNPAFDLSDVTRTAARLARLQGAADLWSQAHGAFTLAAYPEEALYALAAYVANPTVGAIYGAGTEAAEASRAEGVRVAAATALSAIHAIATAGRTS